MSEETKIEGINIYSYNTTFDQVVIRHSKGGEPLIFKGWDDLYEEIQRLKDIEWMYDDLRF